MDSAILEKAYAPAKQHYAEFGVDTSPHEYLTVSLRMGRIQPFRMWPRARCALE